MTACDLTTLNSKRDLLHWVKMLDPMTVSGLIPYVDDLTGRVPELSLTEAAAGVRYR